ncbi:DarT1-associated NADAR antitoxin family protein [Burkholderia pyrrocinia]|uniref:DarT1-associated NADAR antitoxin family protein n=1 Tax=Burkholderia pyrrocinia TaxID=60550 RepID=UPI0030D0691B
MATRPIFIPSLSGPLLVSTELVEFQWFSGMAKSQAQKSIDSLHQTAKERLHVDKVLEISSMSKDDYGVKLSAFNLMIKTPRRQYSLECAYQASKVFERGGPFTDLLNAKSIDAERDPRLTQFGRLIRILWYGKEWPLQPRTAFYDWLYINALHRQPELTEIVLTYRAFSDIAFNPERSIDCQAYAAALYVSLHERGLLKDEILKDQDEYLRVINTGALSNAH